MEILLCLFIIGIVIIIFLYLSGSVMKPILIAGGIIYLIFSTICKAFKGFFRLLLKGLRKLSEIETGKLHKQQMDDLRKVKEKKV